MRFTVILTKAPYRGNHAAEALRYSLAGAESGMEVCLLLVDGAVLLSRCREEGRDGSSEGSSASLKRVISSGVKVLAEKSSVRTFGLEPEGMADGVEIVSSYEISEAVKGADRTLIF
jgi:predicted peroxiredoxin